MPRFRSDEPPSVNRMWIDSAEPSLRGDVPEMGATTRQDRPGVGVSTARTRLDSLLRLDATPTSTQRPTMTVKAGAGSDAITMAAETLHLRGKPDAGKRLRDEHSCDEHGRCRGCPHAGTVAPLFPCRLRLVGEAAVHLAEHPAVLQGADGNER